MEATRNYAHQNTVATWTEVKTLHKQQNSHTRSNTENNLDLWNTSTSNTEIPECLQSKFLHMVVEAPWYMPNVVNQWDLPDSKSNFLICSLVFKV
jgi:hypothetical protein